MMMIIIIIITKQYNNNNNVALDPISLWIKISSDPSVYYPDIVFCIFTNNYIAILL